MEKRLFGIIFVLACFFCINSTAAAEIKIGIIDTQKILTESEKIMQRRMEFFREVEEKQQLLLEKQNAGQMRERELRENSTNMSLAERREMRDELQQEIKNLNRINNELEYELKDNEADL